MAALTDLEAAGMSCVYRNQPCTAHFVRTRFRNSPTARFSDSAGSVYPTMKRLQTRGLLDSQRRREGRRMVRYYECTRAGRAALRSWIGPPLQEDIGITIDPLRTRILCLELLTPRRRIRWLADAEQMLRQQLDQIQSDTTESATVQVSASDVFYELADENARLGIETRLDWIRQARTRLRRGGWLDENA